LNDLFSLSSRFAFTSQIPDEGWNIFDIRTFFEKKYGVGMENSPWRFSGKKMKKEEKLIIL